MLFPRWCVAIDESDRWTGFFGLGEGADVGLKDSGAWVDATVLFLVQRSNQGADGVWRAIGGMSRAGMVVVQSPRGRCAQLTRGCGRLLLLLLLLCCGVPPAYPTAIASKCYC